MADLTKDRVLQILKSRTIVAESGKYVAKVTSVHLHEDKYIVNINAMNLLQAKAAREAYSNDELEAAANSNLSFSVFEGQTAPSKGEFINIQIGIVETRTDGQQLRVIGWSEQPIAAPVSFDFESADVDVLVEEASEFAAIK